jgi:hypothetical protein
LPGGFGEQLADDRRAFPPLPRLACVFETVTDDVEQKYTVSAINFAVCKWE